MTHYLDALAAFTVPAAYYFALVVTAWRKGA